MSRDVLNEVVKSLHLATDRLGQLEEQRDNLLSENARLDTQGMELEDRLKRSTDELKIARDELKDRDSQIAALQSRKRSRDPDLDHGGTPVPSKAPKHGRAHPPFPMNRFGS